MGYSSSGMSMGFIIVILIVVGLISALIFGFATQTIVKNKGYEENWFWWGFFFGFIALIVAACKPVARNYYSGPPQGYTPSQGYSPPLQQEIEQSQPRPIGMLEMFLWKVKRFIHR